MIRTLIAEDEPPIARSIKSMIERLDHQFIVSALAQDGESALRLMDERPFDLVFTDIRMPMMDGLSLLEAIKARWPDTLTVVISGYGTFEYSAAALRAHALDYLLKPVQEDEMRQLLARLKLEHEARARRKLQRLMAAGLNQVQQSEAEPGEQAVLVALFIAPAEGFWDELDLEALLQELLGELESFTWVFMGEAPKERVVLLEDRPGMVELMTYAHEYILGRSAARVDCACTGDGVPLSETRATLRRLRDVARRAEGRFALLPQDEMGEPDLPESARQLAAQVRRHIDEHFGQHITNQVLSDAFGYVPSYIALLFRKAYGLSPSDYLGEVRLERAKALMTEQPGLMVKEVAERVGFKNQYHFSKAFKKKTGLWPTDYIKKG